MEYRLLGASGLEVSVLSFGTMTMGGEGRFAAMGNVQVEEARRQVEICIDAGVNLFDTADVYSFGKSEEVLGQALGARRKEIVLATKAFVGLTPGTNQAGLSRRHLMEACEASLRRMGTDTIDLYQAHNFDSLTPLDETLRAFEDLIRAGKIRYAGCSNYSGWQLMKAQSISERLGIPRYISQQINYFTDRARRGTRTRARRSRPASRNHGVEPAAIRALVRQVPTGSDQALRVAAEHSRCARHGGRGAALPDRGRSGRDRRPS
jgi:aryl-alcohol dehydrogenase-like predicted oxidoreductase